MITHRAHLSAPVRLVVVAILLLVLSVYGSVVLGRSQPTATPTSPALNLFRSWPEGVTLLAATELDLPAGAYQWQTTMLTAQEDNDTPVVVHAGLLIAVSGPVLVEVNDTDVVRLDTGAGIFLKEGDVVLAVSETRDPVDVEIVEIVRIADVLPDETPDQTLPITVPGGIYTLVLVNVPAELNNGSVPQQVIAGAITPGVSISHTADAIPAELVAGEQYALWITALFPSGTSTPEAGTVTPTSTPIPPTTPTPPPPPPTLTPTAPPTHTPMATATATPSETPSPTWTPTVTPTATATATPTEVPPTPTFTPTATPTEVPPPTETPPPV